MLPSEARRGLSCMYSVPSYSVLARGFLEVTLRERVERGFEAVV